MSFQHLLRSSLTGILCLAGYLSGAQRTYAPASVLGAGIWFKLAVQEAGIYKIDVAFLAKLGVNTSNLSSSSLRLFGNGGAMLPEAANGARTDDLMENAIWVSDGNDGVMNGSDYFLFFSNGPHVWQKDSINHTFAHQKSLYSEQCFYYLQVGGGSGKRITTLTTPFAPNVTVTSYNSHVFHELDTVNFLSSGKQWVGEEYSTMPGKLTTRTYNLKNLGSTGGPATLVTNCVARSFGTPGTFNISAGNNPIVQLDIPPVASGPYDLFVREQRASATFIPAPGDLQITFSYSGGSFNSQGWVDWFEVHARNVLSMERADQLLFRDWNSVSPGNSARFVIQHASASTDVWDITRPEEPLRMTGNVINGDLQFDNDCSTLHEYVAFNANNFLLPEAIGKVPNQNLHAEANPGMIIITFQSLLTQAQRLAAYHQQRDGLQTLVVTTNQVFNEFSSGTPDPTALRDFTKMFYDRAGTDTTRRPRYLLLFGDGSFDYKNRIVNNTNFVPAYESNISFDPLSTYTSDDYYGFLDDGDDINANSLNLLDIAIGRLPAQNDQQAKAIVDKIIGYHDPKSLGPWRNELTFIADDEDANLHLQDAEAVTHTVSTIDSISNIEKIYLDAYRQVSGAGGSRYPDVSLAVSNGIFNGTLLWNYTGHGGFRRLAEEVVLDQDVINTFNNPDKLPLFVTATCDFAPYDNPLISSIGENLLLREKTGAIALMTTTRLVFAFSNRVMNQNYLQVALQRKTDGRYLSLGEAVKQSKNFTYTFFGDVNNNRKFTLLGDPALTIGFPENKVKITAINGVAISSVPDTLKALTQYTISGEVTDFNGNKLSAFDGTVYPTVFEKVQTRNTLGNDPDSYPVAFQTQSTALFRGRAKAANGEFSFSFVVPKDIDYRFGRGKLGFYANSATNDGSGAFTDIIIGGTGNGLADTRGPDIKAYLNDEKFVSGGITNDRPLLLLKLSDSSGINITGTGIGHDLVAILDNDPRQSFVLNQFYEAAMDDYRNGTLRFQMPPMTQGIHHLTVKAWDVANNSGETLLDFQVIKQQNLTLNHVLNYPNPFTTRTAFWFEHNHPFEELRISIQIFTISGKLVKTLKSTIISEGNRSNDLMWDGRDEYGGKLGRGVYIYRLRVHASDGKSAEKWEKLYLL